MSTGAEWTVYVANTQFKKISEDSMGRLNLLAPPSGYASDSSRKWEGHASPSPSLSAAPGYRSKVNV